MVPSSTERVPRHTDPDVVHRIRRETERTVFYFAEHPEGIALRLYELDREWDVERALEANAGTIAFLGALAAFIGGRRRAVLPMIVGGFLFQHALQGWCPPLPVLRRLGFRTPREIETERVALKMLRGDFGDVLDGLPARRRAEEAMRAAAR